MALEMEWERTQDTPQKEDQSQDTNVSNAYDQLRLHAAALGSGDSVKIVCPFCRGGRSGEESLSLTRTATGAVVYQCHRAQCPRKGRLDGSYGLHDKGDGTRRPSEFEPRIYSGAIEELPDEARDFFTGKYSFSAETVNRYVGWDPEYKRSVWQVNSPAGAVRGFELRAIHDTRRPKTLHYRHSADAWVGYYGEITNQIVVVEDLVSALKVSSVCRSASLMGSHLSLEKLLDVAKISENIILALDRDATAKASAFCLRYALLIPDLRMMPLQRDLKYWTHEEIRYALADYA